MWRSRRQPPRGAFYKTRWHRPSMTFDAAFAFLLCCIAIIASRLSGAPFGQSQSLRSSSPRPLRDFQRLIRSSWRVQGCQSFLSSSQRLAGVLPEISQKPPRDSPRDFSDDPNGCHMIPVDTRWDVFIAKWRIISAIVLGHLYGKLIWIIGLKTSQN